MLKAQILTVVLLQLVVMVLKKSIVNISLQYGTGWASYEGAAKHTGSYLNTL